MVTETLTPEEQSFWNGLPANKKKIEGGVHLVEVEHSYTGPWVYEPLKTLLPKSKEAKQHIETSRLASEQRFGIKRELTLSWEYTFELKSDGSMIVTEHFSDAKIEHGPYPRGTKFREVVQALDAKRREIVLSLFKESI